MITISANDIKKNGISVMTNHHEALVTVRGQPKYIVLDIDLYEKLREAELEIALAETKKEIKEGRFVAESVHKHIKRVTKE